LGVGRGEKDGWPAFWGQHMLQKRTPTTNDPKSCSQLLPLCFVVLVKFTMVEVAFWHIFLFLTWNFMDVCSPYSPKTRQIFETFSTHLTDI